MFNGGGMVAIVPVIQSYIDEFVLKKSKNPLKFLPAVPKSILCTNSVIPIPLTRLSRCLSSCMRSASSASSMAIGFIVSICCSFIREFLRYNQNQN